MVQGTTCLGEPHLFNNTTGGKDDAYLYTEYHEHQWHMSAPYKSKKAAYQHNCGDCPDPEGPNFADLRHMQQFGKQTTSLLMLCSM